MAGTTLIKIFIIIVCMNTLLYFNGVRVMDSNQNVMEKFIVISGNNSNVTISPELNSSVEGMSKLGKSGGGFISGVVNFIDSLGAVGAFIKFLNNIIFTPFGLFRGLPSIFLIVAIPLAMIAIFGIAYFIRSGN